MKERVVVYPILLRCCEFTSDIFWETIFKDLAYGKTPYGTYIHNDHFCCGYKGKEFSYNLLSTTDAAVLHNDLFVIFKQKVGLLSSKDKISKRLDMENVEESMKEDRANSANVRKKTVKEFLIERFVIDMKHSYSLTLQQTRFLLSMIYIALLFKVLKFKQANNGAVLDFFKFDRRKIIVPAPIYEKRTFDLDSGSKSAKTMAELWSKYLTAMNKQSASLECEN